MFAILPFCAPCKEGEAIGDLSSHKSQPNSWTMSPSIFSQVLRFVDRKKNAFSWKQLNWHAAPCKHLESQKAQVKQAEPLKDDFQTTMRF